MQHQLLWTLALLLPGAGEGAAAPAPVVIAAEAIQPQLAIDGAGAIHVVCIHRGDIAVLSSRDGGKTFGGPSIAIDTRGRTRGGLQRGPRIGVDRKGKISVTAPVVFDEEEYKKRYPTSELYLVESSDGGKSWTRPLRINEVAKKAPEALHWMAVAPEGEVHVSWLDLREAAGGQDLYYARIAGGKVGKNIRVARDVCNCCAPGLAVDGRGDPFIAYREGGSKESREVLAIRSTDRGATFSKAARLNQRPTNEAG
ncbi:MAG: hypothetical protein ACRD2T_00910 [Thermoanaerobaculia bacterium]